jgi:acetyltransferase-like isoleucine patch superfamily enzyme
MHKIEEATKTPWKISNELGRWLIYPYLRLLFAVNHIPWGRDWRIYGAPVIQKHTQSAIQIGSNINLRSSLRSNPLGANHPVFLCTWQAGAVLNIGSHFAMTGGSICAAERITICDNVGVGANSVIVDTDFHSTIPEIRLQNPLVANTAPVTIEEGVFIGMNCIVLKGVTIGKASIIGAGSVVSKSIPPHVIAAGNPAKVIKEL